MHGYPQFSFWISIATDIIYLSHIVIIWEKNTSHKWAPSLSITGLKSPLNSKQALIEPLNLMHKGLRFNDSLKLSEFTRSCMGNHSSMITRWQLRAVFLIQILLIFSGHCNCYFWDIPLKVYRLPYFNMLFQRRANKIFQKRTVFMFTKSWSHDQLMQKLLVILLIPCKQKWKFYWRLLSLFACLFNFSLLAVVVVLPCEQRLHLRCVIWHAKSSLCRQPFKSVQEIRKMGFFPVLERFRKLRESCTSLA